MKNGTRGLRNRLFQPDRRSFLGGVGALAASPILFPKPLRAKSNGQVIVRGLGGAYQDVMNEALYKPFQKETGINVVIKPASGGQIRAMIAAGRVELDVLDMGNQSLYAFRKQGALERIDYDAMTRVDPDSIYEQCREDDLVGNIYFASVLTYNTDAFETGSHPRSWSDFWDLNLFPGPRTLADMSAGTCELEFALLADGVQMADLYPLDIDRAFTSLDRIRKSVVKWWNTGALSAQLMERKEAMLGGAWNGRIQPLIDGGAPLAIEWNQSKRQLQSWAIVKGSPNKKNATKFIDFALQPNIQAKVAKHLSYGPTNKKTLDVITPEVSRMLPNSPEHYTHSFDRNDTWWAENLEVVGRRWQSWVLGG